MRPGRVGPLSALFLLVLTVSAASPPQTIPPLRGIHAHPDGEHFPWCGNTITDPDGPKGLSDWALFRLMQGKAQKALPVAKGGVTSEAEPNNTRQSATFVDLSSGSATVTGLRDIPISPPTPTGFSAPENNDSIGTATTIPLAPGVTNGREVLGAQIGDGQFGATSGDFDFYEFQAIRGQLFLFDVTSAGGLDPIAGIYDSSGNLLFLQDDEVPGSAFDPYFTWTPEADGFYYLVIAGFARDPLPQSLPQNPQQPGTGQGAGTTGIYDLAVWKLTPTIGAFEENGAIPAAVPINNTAGQLFERTIAGFIGDAQDPLLQLSGDYDFFSFSASAGQTFIFDITTPDPSGSNGLDPAIGIMDQFGQVLEASIQRDQMGMNEDARLIFTAENSGTYYLVVGADIIDIPQFNFPDPFTGIGSGAASTGNYVVIMSTLNEDPDWLQFDLTEGDVFSVRAIGGVVAIGVTAPDGSPQAYTATDANMISSQAAPFPRGGGGSSITFIVPQTGRYAMELISVGLLLQDEPWQVDMVINEPGLRNQPAGARQIVFLDFDGATVDAGVLTGPNEMRALSPMSSFLSAWGLSPADESALIDVIVANVEENLREDLRLSGVNGDFDTTGNPGEFAVTILNSRDHADPWGQPNVSRLVIGGTQAELGVETIGIAESIDPGNFNTEETGVVLLDLLSRPANDTNSINQYAIASGSSKLTLVGTIVGNITAHEIGHYVGNWHTINNNAQPNIMDKGGILDNTAGVGNDDTWGTADDVDVDFVTDTYDRGELYFLGFEDCLRTTAIGLSTGTQAPTTDPADLWMLR